MKNRLLEMLGPSATRPAASLTAQISILGPSAASVNTAGRGKVPLEVPEQSVAKTGARTGGLSMSLHKKPAPNGCTGSGSRLRFGRAGNRNTARIGKKPYSRLSIRMMRRRSNSTWLKMPKGSPSGYAVSMKRRGVMRDAVWYDSKAVPCFAQHRSYDIRSPSDARISNQNTTFLVLR